MTHKYHTTREGKKMLISDMSDEHLNRTIALWRRKADKGIKFIHGGGGPDVDSIWYDEYILYGQEALNELYCFKDYMEEANKRFVGNEGK